MDIESSSFKLWQLEKNGLHFSTDLHFPWLGPYKKSQNGKETF